MRTVNKVIIIWNVTRDPVIKTTEGGKKIALFNVATNRYFKTADGEQKSESEFNNCIAWGTLAERLEKYLVKGKLVYLEGRLKTRVIEKDDGEKLYKTEIVVANVIFLNKRWDFGDTSSSEETKIESVSTDDDLF
jgi:single-strand DNA-binding protein